MTSVSHEAMEHLMQVGVNLRDKARSVMPNIGYTSLPRRMTQLESYQQALSEIRDIPKWRSITARLTEYTQRSGNFFFVQIGANDGVRGDPVREHVLKHNWSGLLVEPVPHVFGRLKHNYVGQAGLSFANVAVSHNNGSATMLAPLELPDGAPNPLSHLSTFDSRVIRKHKWAKDIGKLMQPTEVQTVTLPTLFEEFSVEHIDGLFVDTEGHDKTILDQLDLSAVRPHFVLYEHGHLPANDQADLADRFTSAGYGLTTMRRDTFADLGPHA